MPALKDKHIEQVWQRIDAVVNLILENDRYLQSRRTKELTLIIAKKFNTSKRTAQRYIEEAREEIRKIGKSKKEEAFEKAIRDRELLFLKCKGVKDDKGEYIILPDIRLALEVIKDRDKIFGLYVENINYSGGVKIIKDNID